MHVYQDGRMQAGQLVVVAIWIIAFGGYVGNIVIAAVGALAALLLWNMSSAILHRIRMRQPITLEGNSYSGVAQHSPQYWDLTIKAQTFITVRYIQVLFTDGLGTKPTIQELGDWEAIYRVRQANIGTREQADGSWYWTYSSPWERAKKSRITIGVQFLAIEPYKGTIELKLTPQGPPGESKIVHLPIYIGPAIQSKKGNNAP